MTVETATACAVRVLRGSKAHTATVYMSDKLVVRVTRRLYERKILRGRGVSRQEFHLTIGQPNYRGRLFIKQVKKAGEPFPIRRPQLTFPPKLR